MYRQNPKQTHRFTGVEKTPGETIEQKVYRVIKTKEPIRDGAAAVIYTERKDGVLPDYNVRTDRWEHAAAAMDIVHRTSIAKRDGTPPGGVSTNLGDGTEGAG